MYIAPAVIFIIQYFCLAENPCTNGGKWISHDCTTTNDCKLRTISAVQCLNNECCTVPQLTCENGGMAIAAGCEETTECLPFATTQVACLKNLCCTVCSIHVF